MAQGVLSGGHSACHRASGRHVKCQLGTQPIFHSPQPRQTRCVAVDALPRSCATPLAPALMCSALCWHTLISPGSSLARSEAIQPQDTGSSTSIEFSGARRTEETLCEAPCIHMTSDDASLALVQGGDRLQLNAYLQNPHSQARLLYAVSDEVLEGGFGATPVPEKYVPGPVEVTWQIYVGAAVATFPFVLGSWELGKRILIQKRCSKCDGIGLVMKGKYYKKCTECGGFFPWLGWKKFWTSTALPGNGGPLLQPRGQTSVLYKVPPPRPPPSQKAADASQAAETSQAANASQADGLEKQAAVSGSVDGLGKQRAGGGGDGAGGAS